MGVIASVAKQSKLVQGFLGIIMLGHVFAIARAGPEMIVHGKRKKVAFFVQRII
jgi:hypothetical protein